MKRLRYFTMFAMSILISVLPATQSSAVAPAADPKVIMLIVEHLELADITPDKTPTLYRMANEDALGLIALRKAFAYKNIASAFYATVGSGSTAAGFEPVRFDASFETRAKRIAQFNRSKNTRAIFGALGQSLHNQALKTAAIGQTTPEANVRNTEFMNIIMDAKGLVDFQAISSGPASAAKIEEDIKRFYGEADLIVANLSDPTNPILGTETIKRADSLAGKLSSQLKADDLLIVLMPFSKTSIDYGLSQNLISKGEPLSPLILHGGGMTGLLKSGTTRRTGVISAGDLMPTMLQHLKIETTMRHTGRPIYAEPFFDDKIAFLREVAVKAVRHDAYMLPVLVFMTVWSLLVLVATLVSATGREDKKNVWLRSALLSVFLLPTAVNLTAFLGLRSLIANFAFIIAITALAPVLVLKMNNKLAPMLFALGMLPLLLTIDTFTGQVIANNSLMGNSVLSGGRYYGVGNQFLGFLFAFTVLFFIFLGTDQGATTNNAIYKLFLGLVFVFLLISVGSARLGANFGGLITLAVSLPVVYFRLISKNRLSVRLAAILASTALITIFGFTYYDVVQKSPDQSHIGKSFSIVRHDTSFAVGIIKTKISKNLEETTMILFRWGGIFGVPVLLGLLYSARRSLMDTLAAYPLFRRAMPGIFLAAFVAYFYNDTGFEPLAIICLYSLAALLYLRLLVKSTIQEPAAGSRMDVGK